MQTAGSCSPTRLTARARNRMGRESPLSSCKAPHPFPSRPARRFWPWEHWLLSVSHGGVGLTKGSRILIQGAAPENVVRDGRVQRPLDSTFLAFAIGPPPLQHPTSTE